MANDEIQHRLEEAFAASGLTQAALSRASGIDRSSISLYLSGRYKPKADKLLRLAAALSVTPEWLSGMEANAPEPSALLPVAQELDEQGGLRFTEERRQGIAQILRVDLILPVALYNEVLNAAIAQHSELQRLRGVDHGDAVRDVLTGFVHQRRNGIQPHRCPHEVLKLGWHL